MFEVLMFIFENYMDNSACLRTDNHTIVLELEKIGFERYEIDRALDWLEGISHNKITASPSTSFSIRHYVPEECEQLGMEGRGFLLYLEQVGVLDPVTREMVIDRVMALDRREVNLGKIRWVTLMILFTQPDKKEALTLLQDMILADALGVLHA